MPRSKILENPQASEDFVHLKFQICRENRNDLSRKILEFERYIENAKREMELQYNLISLKLQDFYSNLQIRAGKAGIARLTLKELRKRRNFVATTVQFLQSKSATPPPHRRRSHSCSFDSKLKRTGSLRSSSCQTSIRNATSDDKLRTPVQNVPPVPAVTPKVNPNQPIAVLRRPRLGEFVVSLLGSPLMVTSVSHDNMASVSIPLSDGKILSILPTEGLDAAELNLDTKTRQQLNKLRQNLTKCLQK